MGTAQRAGAFITLSAPLTLLCYARASTNLSANMSHTSGLYFWWKVCYDMQLHILEDLFGSDEVLQGRGIRFA